MTTTVLPYVDLLSAVLRKRRLVLTTGVVVAALTLLAGLVEPRAYTAKASFFPRTRRPMAAVSGIAAQLGLTLPTSDVTEGAAFFDQLLRTREVLDSVLMTEYRYQSDSGFVVANLLTLYRVTGDSALRTARGRKRLERALRTYIDYKSGVIALDVTASHPDLAVQIANRLLALLDTYNRETRRGQATAERQFTEQRLGEVRAELRAAEDRLQGFLTRNREYRSSAQLTFEQERLQREVTLRQQVYTTLSQANEQARIEEVRDTPVLTIVQPPRPPELPNGRRLAVKCVVAFMLGAVLAMIVVLTGLQARRFREREPARFGELESLRRETLADLRRPWRLFGLGR